MRRRSFFVASAAAGLSIYARGGEHRSTERGDIPKRVFGKTGERLTIVGQAGGRFPLCGYEDAKDSFGDWAEEAKDRAREMGDRIRDVAAKGAEIADDLRERTEPLRKAIRKS